MIYPTDECKPPAVTFCPANVEPDSRIQCVVLGIDYAYGNTTLNTSDL
jgi:hypothetical protein